MNKTDVSTPLDALFAPQSIAVVGASQQASKIGGIPLDYLLHFGWQGALYAVNPRADTVQGLPAYPSLAAIGQPVDVAVVAVPQAQVAAVLEDAIAARVRALVIFSSGFAEVEGVGAQAQQTLAARAKAAGVQLIGPNCMGFMRPSQGIYATFTPAVAAGRAAAGHIGLVSQSGAFGAYAYCMARERGLGLSLWATTGNEADVQLADVLAWLARDAQTHVIMAYMEGCRDGPRLRAALAMAQAAGKPVIMVKVGTSDLGAAAAASHTASLAGNDAVYEAVLRRYGVLRAHSVSEFFALAASASIAPRPKNRSIGFLTVSGGVGALMADAASNAQLEVPPLPEAAQQQLRAWVPFAAPRNPVDITGQVANDASLLERSARLMLESGQFGSWLGFFAAAGLADAFWPTLHGMVQRLCAAFPDTLLAVCTLMPPERRTALEALGCLVFDDPSQAVRCIGALAALTPPAPPIAIPGPAAVTPLELPHGPLSEAQSLALLQQAGVPVVEHLLVKTAEQAAAAVQALGGCIALKIASADIAHKSDIGGVQLHIDTSTAAHAAFARISTNTRRAFPQARIDGVLAARMVTTKGGVECIAGIQRDPVFGLVLMFGLGGIHAEILHDVALRPLPVSRTDVLEMMDEPRAAALFSGARGNAPVDKAALADVLCALAAFAERAGDTLESIDINPLLAMPLGEGCLALDALVIGHNGEQT